MQEQKKPTMMTREEILGWVRETIAANGEKYTVLTKEAQLGIARFIDELVNERKEDNVNAKSDDKNGDEGDSTKLYIADENGNVKPAMILGYDEGKDTPEKEKEVEPCVGSPVENLKERDDGKEEVVESIPSDKPIPDRMMRRVDFLRSKGMDAQAVYDSFLMWKKSNPSKATVMDFSNGKKVEDAAFVYWLMEFRY